MTNKIIFLEVNKTSLKLFKIVKSATFYFKNKKRLLFLVENEKAKKFLDNFLWQEPKFSFLPHTTEEPSTKDLIIISTSILKDICYLFNLTTKPIEEFSFFKTIYEFDDNTSKEKIKLSKQKFNFYKKKNLKIQAI